MSRVFVVGRNVSCEELTVCPRTGLIYVVVYFVTDSCLLCYICFSLSVLSQEIGWEERLRNDLFCVGWDVKP